MGYVQPTSRKRQVLVAAAPGDWQAFELAEELRALGLDVVVAETVEQASHADEFAVCVIVLRPEKWRITPSITTAMRCNPRYMLPVLAEPMSLPSGSWAARPISIEEPLTQTAKELEEFIVSYLRILANEDALLEQRLIRSAAGASMRLRESSMQSPTYKKARSQRNNWYNRLLWILALVLVAGLLVYYAPRFTKSINTQALQQVLSTPQGPVTSSTLFSHAYAAAVPGPNCDFRGADWQVGTYFKKPATPVTANTTKLPNSTPTLQVIMDKSTYAACQNDGLLVRHDDHFDTYALVFFSYQDMALPRHFSTQITATVMAGSPSASITLGVHHQISVDANDLNSGYGDDSIAVGVNGRWETDRFNDKDGYTAARFTRGFIKPTKVFTLAAEVDGPIMTFSLNGKKVTTVVDTTYPDGYDIDFGIADPDAKSPPSARFSDFTYTPLPDTHLTTNAAVATATAQNKKALQVPYTSSVPGFGCDKGAGQWKPVSEAEDYVTVSCLPNGLAVSQGATAKYNGDVSFYWLDGNFPTNYKVKAQIDVGKLNSGCAGVTTRTDDHAAGYTFYICSDSSWQIYRYDSAGGSGHQLANGSVAQHSSYTLEATSNGPTQSLSLDGVQVSSVNDKTLTATDHIELSMYADQGTAGTVVFSNFVFTPLP